MIPKGRVTTYGAIAKAVGFPNYFSSHWEML